MGVLITRHGRERGPGGRALRAAFMSLTTAAALGACTLPASRSRDALVTQPSACAPQRLEIYFEENHARLTAPARTAIGLTASRLQGCAISHVQVTGLADASGGAAANMALSQRRAQAVVEALESVGWPAPAFEVAAAGAEGAVTPGGLNEPLRRRVELVITAGAR